MESMECLNKDAQKEKGQILYITSRANKFTTSTKLLDITHDSYGISADLIETVN